VKGSEARTKSEEKRRRDQAKGRDRVLFTLYTYVCVLFG
jgi:hypothetical protein